MAVSTREDAILGLSAEALAQLDERQLELLDVLGPELVNARSRSGDGALGFGEADITWVAAVVPVASVVLDVLLTAAKDAASDVVKDGILAAIRRLRARRRGVDGVGHPSEELAAAGADIPEALLERIRGEAFRHACAVGLDEARARTVASAVAGSLGPTPRPTR